MITKSSEKKLSWGFERVLTLSDGQIRIYTSKRKMTVDVSVEGTDPQLAGWQRKHPGRTFTKKVSSLEEAEELYQQLLEYFQK